MNPTSLPLFSILQNKLGYLSERQRLIAQNVANASTPGYTPVDLKAFSEQPGMKPAAAAGQIAPVSPVQTDAAHMVGTSGKPSAFASQAAPDSETTLNGNQVVLEEQMMKMSEARNDYDAAVGFYQKALQMLHLAVQKPGG